MSKPLTVAERAPMVGDVLIDPEYPNLWQKRRVISFVNDGASGVGYRHYGRKKEHFVVTAAMRDFIYIELAYQQPASDGQRGEE